MDKKRLVIGGFGLLSALGVCSVSMSLAWYASGTRLLVSGVDVTFVGAKEIKIGVKEDGEFKESLSDELNQIENYYPVSSMFSSSWLGNKKTTPEFRDSYKGVVPADKSTYQESTLATGGYFQQEFYLYSEHKLWVTIDKDMVSFTPNEEKNKEKAKHYADLYSQDESEILEDLNNVTKSLRFSLLNPDEDEYSYHIIDPYKSSDTYLCGTLDNSQDGYYDSIGGQEIVYGEYDEEDEIIFTPADDEDSPLNGRSSVFNAKHKAGNITFDESQFSENKMGAHKEDSITLDEIEDKIEIPLEAQTPKKVVLSVYLEGWDRDNTDCSAYGSFYASIGFKIGREH